MPFTNIAEAKEAKFPTTVNEVELSLSQINRLAELYDAIKKSGSADDPMAVAMSQWKKEHRKSDDSWVSAEVFGEEIPATNYDPKTHVVKAIKVGTVGHSPTGIPFECTAEWLYAHADDWTGGKLIVNHYGAESESHADIERSWFDGEFEMMQLINMNAETERRMESGEHTGFSFDAVGDPNDPANVMGTHLSILFYPHRPACPATEGCGLAADDGDTESKSHIMTTEDTQTILGSEAMTEDKTYTSAEIESIKAESAKVAATLATLEAEAKTYEGKVIAYKAEISERGDMISELKEKADTLFAAEDVEKKIEDAKATMFSAEDVEAAKKEAIGIAIAAEKDKLDSIASELDVVSKMFPEGLAEDFRTEIVAMIKDGKSHEAFVKLGEVDFTAFKTNISTDPTGESVETEEIVAASVGSWNPRTKEWI